VAKQGEEAEWPSWCVQGLAVQGAACCALPQWTSPEPWEAAAHSGKYVTGGKMAPGGQARLVWRLLSVDGVAVPSLVPK
jgi:hypothetical protein